jgi:hypothetical protein
MSFDLWVDALAFDIVHAVAQIASKCPYCAFGCH